MAVMPGLRSALRSCVQIASRRLCPTTAAPWRKVSEHLLSVSGGTPLPGRSFGPAVRRFHSSSERGDLSKGSCSADSSGYEPAKAPVPAEGNRAINPFSPRFARTTRPFFPICATNLRRGHGAMLIRKKRKRKYNRGKASKGVYMKHNKGGYPLPRTWQGGMSPLYRRVPRWPEAKQQLRKDRLEPLNLSKLRYFIEAGRLDTRYPITQRHLNDCRCARNVKNGVKLFNVNDYPFPYQIDIEVAGADQSSIDAIRAVGGSVTIVYMEKIALKAHMKPWLFDVLPRTARPQLKMVHYLEKMRARGARVRYIKPLWLLEEEKRMQMELRELAAEERIDPSEDNFESGPS
jgi:large subunit ribosomal protein L15